MRRTCFVLPALVLAVASMLTVSPAAAGTGSATFTGTFAGAPTMAVVSISTPNCTAQGSTPVRYHEYPFYVTEDGTYDFSILTVPGTPSTLASVYVMTPGFDPAAAFPNCLFGTNNGNPPAPGTMSVPLTANTPYVAVPFDDTFAQSTLGYELTISGPGDILSGDGESVLAIPTVSQWGLMLLASLLALGGLARMRRSRTA